MVSFRHGKPLETLCKPLRVQEKNKFALVLLSPLLHSVQYISFFLAFTPLFSVFFFFHSACVHVAPSSGESASYRVQNHDHQGLLLPP